jgi:hypothetical protein
MARREQDREDLLREAVALVRRVELRLGEEPRSIFAGFRTNGGVSIYFGLDLVLQFNSQRELRRAYFGSALIKAEKGRLWAMTRERGPHEVRLLAEVMSDKDRSRFLATAREKIERLHQALASGQFARIGQFPENEDVIADLRSWLDAIPETLAIALSPGSC